MLFINTIIHVSTIAPHECVRVTNFSFKVYLCNMDTVWLLDFATRLSPSLIREIYHLAKLDWSKPKVAISSHDHSFKTWTGNWRGYIFTLFVYRPLR
jgi:hypothetical protein